MQFQMCNAIWQETSVLQCPLDDSLLAGAIGGCQTAGPTILVHKSSPEQDGLSRGLRAWVKVQSHTCLSPARVHKSIESNLKRCPCLQLSSQREDMCLQSIQTVLRMDVGLHLQSSSWCSGSPIDNAQVYQTRVVYVNYILAMQEERTHEL